MAPSVRAGIVASIFDVRHVSIRALSQRPKLAEQILAAGQAQSLEEPDGTDCDLESGLETIYRSSAQWLFYRDGIEGTLRLFLPAHPGIDNCWGASLLVDTRFHAGVMTIWRKYGSGADLLKASNDAWDSSGQDPYLYDQEFGTDTEDNERFYPFVVAQFDTPGLDGLTEEDARYIGRLFTGGVGGESESQLAQYAQGNISMRERERLYVRWTNGLAIYDRDLADWPCAAARAVQVFEHMVLIRRTFLNLSERTDSCFHDLTLFRPWAFVEGNRILQDYLAAQARFATTPVQSIEAERLFDTYSTHFGIGRQLSEADRRTRLLDQRVQWLKAQWLGLVAIAVFAFNTALTIFRSH